MIKKVLKIIVVILMIIGIFYGVSITIKKEIPKLAREEKEVNIINMVQNRIADIKSFYTYGRAFNISGEVSNINKDNFEGAKLIITDGEQYEKSYNLNYEFKDNKLNFSSDIEINSGIIIDELENKDYYCLLRLKLNNSANPKYYSFVNSSEYKDIEYYTITKERKK